MIIKEMIFADIPQVLEIERQSFSNPWSEQSLIESAEDRNNIYFVVKIEDEIAGYCGCKGIFDEGHILHIAIKEKYRGRGIGKEFLREVMHRVKDKGLNKFTLEVRESNEFAIKLYKGLGFEELGKRKDFYTNPIEDGVIMWKG